MIAHKRKCERCGAKPPQVGRLVCQCCRMREWRALSPLKAEWARHRAKAKSRGIAVDWDFWEFADWCSVTGWLEKKREGMQIHRVRNARGYSIGNCCVISGRLNGYIGGKFERWGRRGAIKFLAAACDAGETFSGAGPF